MQWGSKDGAYFTWTNYISAFSVHWKVRISYLQGFVSENLSNLAFRAIHMPNLLRSYTVGVIF